MVVWASGGLRLRSIGRSSRGPRGASGAPPRLSVRPPPRLTVVAPPNPPNVSFPVASRGRCGPLPPRQDYTEAHKIKLKCDALEAWELEKWQNSKQQEMFQREAKFKHQKQQELIALQKRIHTGREEQKKQRQMDLERLLQRYQNVKSELEAQQNLERIRAERMSASGQWQWGAQTAMVKTGGKAKA